MKSQPRILTLTESTGAVDGGGEAFAGHEAGLLGAAIMAMPLPGSVIPGRGLASLSPPVI